MIGLTPRESNYDAAPHLKSCLMVDCTVMRSNAEVRGKSSAGRNQFRDDQCTGDSKCLNPIFPYRPQSTLLDVGLKLGSRRGLSAAARLEKVTQSQPCRRCFHWLPNALLHDSVALGFVAGRPDGLETCPSDYRMQCDFFICRRVRPAAQISSPNLSAATSWHRE